jgi:arginine deiminase
LAQSPVAFGAQSMVAPLRSVLLKRPDHAFIGQETIDRQWRDLDFLEAPRFEQALLEYDAFVALLADYVAEIHYLPPAGQSTLDSIYAYDPAIITARGAVLCRMGKPQRRGEPAAIGAALATLGVPILGPITGEGTLEGGDALWVDERTLAVGLSARTNQEGIRQLRIILDGLIDELVTVPLGPNVMHLMGQVSLVDEDLALVYSKLLPDDFRSWLRKRGIELLELPESEYQGPACNVLAVAPRKCILLAGNPGTRALLESRGVEVWEYEGREISWKGSGGPTCLTRPLLRA